MSHVLLVDRRGLARKLEHRPKAWLLFELIQNAWDEPGVTKVQASAEMVGPRRCLLRVEDDAPGGWADLRSAYTLFRDSKKAGNPELRGRFELGEKLVFAVALRAQVHTSSGMMLIDGDERTMKPRQKRREPGSVVTVEVTMTKAEYEEVCADVRSILPPHGIVTTFNEELIPFRTPRHGWETTLATVIAGEDMHLRPTRRRTTVRLIEPLEGEEPYLYELGLPVVPTGDHWHYDVQQRVPVNWERNNVPPSYLQHLRVEALNHLAAAKDLTVDDAVSTWVAAAIDDADAEPDAVREVIHQRYGDKIVTADPSDPEGTKIAVSQGYTVVHGSSLPKGAWAHVRQHKLILPAGQVTPSPRPYDVNGAPEHVLQPGDYTEPMIRMVAFARRLFDRLIGGPLDVVLAIEPDVSWVANYGRRRLCLNVARLGRDWFKKPRRDPGVLDLLLHEFCHHRVSDHLSHDMHEEATRLGAKLANICLDEPGLFLDNEYIFPTADARATHHATNP